MYMEGIQFLDPRKFIIYIFNLHFILLTQFFISIKGTWQIVDVTLLSSSCKEAEKSYLISEVKRLIISSCPWHFKLLQNVIFLHEGKYMSVPSSDNEVCNFLSSFQKKKKMQ